jgi:hypothetical protein
MERTCFIVQPMYDRAKTVFRTYLEPALINDFVLYQPGVEASDSITGEVFDHLKQDTLVLCYLSAPSRSMTTGNNWYWNPNVMLEAGYRLGQNRPILFVRDKRSSPDEPIMPFDIKDHTVIELLAPDEERNKISVQVLWSQIRDAANAITSRVPQRPTILYSHPSATMSFTDGRGTVTAASDDVAVFYRYPPGTNLVGFEIREMVDQLISQLVPSQRVAFQAEQEALIGALFLGRKPTATVCIVFGKDPLLPGGTVDNAYLPIVSRFRAAWGEPTTLEVLYLDVTGAASVGVDGVVRCRFDLRRALAASE